MPHAYPHYRMPHAYPHYRMPHANQHHPMTMLPCPCFSPWQVHGLADGTVQIYSRNAECTTGKFPDLVQAVQK
ncbi:unnamed protein product [Closterium sp. NIES-53]